MAALGVDDATIAADYSQSNYWHEQFAGQVAKDMVRLFSLGFDESSCNHFSWPNHVLSSAH
ncbi:MAG: hypothetical protein R3C44_24185 [Chloroflexota bacterium]